MTFTAGLFPTAGVEGAVQVLVVESTADPAEIWRRHLQRQWHDVVVVHSDDDAVTAIAGQAFDVIILDLVLEHGSALAVADHARYRQPAAKVIVVTDTTFFSDGSIFAVTPNARAFVQSATPPDDLAAMVEHFGRAA